MHRKYEEGNLLVAVTSIPLVGMINPSISSSHIILFCRLQD